MTEFTFFLTGPGEDAMLEESHVSDATPTVLGFQAGHPTFIRQGALFSLEPL